MTRNTAKESDKRRKSPVGKAGKEPSGRSGPAAPESVQSAGRPAAGPARRNGGWREIEALREKAALKASLADVWDEDFDLDEEILAELDHTAEFFTTQEEAEEEAFDDDAVIDEYFDEDDEI